MSLISEVSMANPVIEVINRHGPARHYQPDALPPTLSESIIMAAQHTSSSSNLQVNSVVTLTDPVKRSHLSELCGNQRHIAEAPASE
jgi:FMN reductase [NAD(P)H]